MPEYIDRDKVHEIIFKLQKYVWTKPCTSPCNEKSMVIVGADDVDFEVDKIPAADVAPVVHGKWKPTEYPIMSECEDCSECGYRTVYGHGFKFCPNCGAKMDGGN